MTTLDARLEAIRQELLRELFLGTAEGLRERLRPLTEDDRAALNATLSDLLNNLPAMFSQAAQFRFSNEFQPTGPNVGFFRSYYRNWDFKNLYQKIGDNSDFFNEPGWIEGIELVEHDIMSSQFRESRQARETELSNLHIRFLFLKFGIGSRTQVLSAFQFPRDVNFFPLFVVEPGQVLLDRSAQWTLDVLLKMAKSPRKYFLFSARGCGLAKLLTEVRQRFPAWNDRLEPYYAKAIEEEGLWNYFNNPETDVAPEILLAGFLADPLPSDIEGQFLDSRGRKLFLELSEKGLISRRQLLESVLNRLVTADRNLIAEGWRQYLIDLVPTHEERTELYHRYLDLIGASSTTAQFALGECAAMWTKGIIPNEEFIAALTAALRHVSQPVCVKAWKLLLKAAGPDQFQLLATAAVDALSAPHKTLRAETIKWLLKHRSSLSADQITDIAALAPSLPTTDRDSLAPLLALAGTEQDASTNEPAAITSENEEAALAATVAEFKKLRLDAVSRQRLAFIEGFLAGHPVGLDAVPPSLVGALEIDVHPYESPAALADGFLETGATKPTVIQYELLLDSIQRFRDAASDTTVRKTIDPLVKQFERIKAEQADLERSFNFWRQRQFPNAACLLAHLWISGQSLADDPDVQRMLATETLWFRLAVLSLEVHKGFRLALPTHHDGWIHPRVFAERISTLPEKIEQFELLQALYRLPAIPECSAEAWDALPQAYKTTDKPIAWILAVALGPEDRFESAIAALTAFFQANPPNDALYQQELHYLDLKTDEFRKMVQQRLSAENNVVFRLFCAALRVRFGLGDARSWTDGVPLSGLEGYFFPDIELHFEEHFRNSKHRSEIFQSAVEEKKCAEGNTALAQKLRDELLFNPKPITREMLYERLHEHQAYFRDSILAHLFPYLFPNVRTISSVEPERFPAGAQRFFELGISGLVPPPVKNGQTYNPFLSSFDLNELLIRLGKLPHVDVAFAFDELSHWLANEKQSKRDLVVELFHQWLLDGRATPTALAAVIARRLRETGKGYTYLDAALGLFSNLSESGRLFALLTCETALAGPLSEIPARNLSILLDRFERLLDETGRAIPDGPARTNLAALGSAKKKSAVTTKARLLSSRNASPGQLPVEVAVVFELLKSARHDSLPPA